MFVLDIGIKQKDSLDNTFAICGEVEQILNVTCNSSGFLFQTQTRDMQFDFETELKAKEAEIKVREIFIKYNIEISEQDSYINVWEDDLK